MYLGFQYFIDPVGANSVGDVLLYTRAPDFLLQLALLVAAVSLVAAVLLIPIYGILGAAIANLAGSLALTVATVGAYVAAVRDGEGAGFLAIGAARTSPASIGSVTE